MGKASLAIKQYRFLKKIVAESFAGSSKVSVASFEKKYKSLHRATVWRYKKSLSELLSDGFLELSGEVIKLTEKGQNIIKSDSVFSVELLGSKKWDKIWRVVAYDIPEKNKTSRDYFRRKLKEMGFRQIQDSLWVVPFECREEIALLANELNISNFVAIMTTDKVPQNEKMLKVFGL